MKNFNERFTPETLRNLQGAYIFNSPNQTCDAIIPYNGMPLTIENFALLIPAENKLFTADDFRWYDDTSENIDLDFAFEVENSYFDYLSRYEIPEEVNFLLDSVICTKFALKHLNEEKLTDAICAFQKASDTLEKLRIAREALAPSKAASIIFTILEEMKKSV